MKIVSNTGPLIALAKIDQLALLAQIFTEVYIPPVVYRELLAKTGPETTRLDEALSRFIQVAPAPSFPPEVKLATLRLDPGEQQAVALACQFKELLVIDDRAGRAAARRLEIAITGTAGVLLQAKKMGLIPAVYPLLQEAQQQGYWFSDAVLDLAARLAGES